MAANHLLEEDSWLARAMGRPAFRVSLPVSAQGLAPLREARDAFAYVKIEPTQVAAAKELQAFGFFLVDTNVQLSLESPCSPGLGTQVRVRTLKRGEGVELAADLRRIAETSFEHTRFHLDPLLERTVADRIKGEWVAGFFRGERGEKLFVAEEGGKPLAFLLAVRAGSRWAIDLIATAKEAQGRGAGRAMVAAMGKECGPAIDVGTQLANLPSLKFYQALGFRVSGAKYVLHFHSPRAA